MQRASVFNRHSFASNRLFFMLMSSKTQQGFSPHVHCMLQGLNPGRQPALGGEGLSASLRAYFCVLGHLYAAARLELMQMAATLHMEAHLTTSHMRQHVSSLS